MFYFISGKLYTLDPSFAVIDAGGVGYKLTISMTTFAHLSALTDKEHATLFTHMAVREDGVELFGFGSTEELDAFKLLITVSGVGPKAAMSILSQLTPKRLAVAICSDDKKSISQANGVGAKTAARIVLELKDKISNTSFSADELTESESFTVTDTVKTSKRADAQEALMALGYSRNEASAVLKTIDVDKYELDDVIRLALKKIMK